MKNTSSAKGMTLVEIMVAMTILSFVIMGSTRFLVQNLKTYQYETGKILVNHDIRKFTTQMIDDGTYANSFQIYDQASNLSRSLDTPVGSPDPTSTTYKGYTTALATTPPATPVNASTPGTEAVAAGLPGDVVVFVYKVEGDDTKIQQLIIYYRLIVTAPGGATGANSTTVANRVFALKRLVVKIHPAAQTAPLLQLLPELTTATNGTTIFTSVDGQANDLVPTGTINRINKMFYNNGGLSVLIRGRIYENYTAQRLIKSTYNFTISPRG